MYCYKFMVKVKRVDFAFLHMDRKKWEESKEEEYQQYNKVALKAEKAKRRAERLTEKGNAQAQGEE